LTDDIDGSDSKKPCVSAKESYISTKKTYISVKEPYIAAFEAYMSTKVPSVPGGTAPGTLTDDVDGGDTEMVDGALNHL